MKVLVPVKRDTNGHLTRRMNAGFCGFKNRWWVTSC